MVDYTFGVCNGMRVNNLHQLAQAFDFMSDSDYTYHTKDGKNDFSNWVRDTLGIPSLADRLITARNDEEAELFVLEHLANLVKQRLERRVFE